MDMDRRSRVLFQILIFLALLLGWFTAIFFDPFNRLPMAPRLLLLSLPFAILPVVIGWLNPARWWFAAAGAFVPLITGVSGLLKLLQNGPPEYGPPFIEQEPPNFLLAYVVSLLPLITTLAFAYLGRRLGQRRLRAAATGPGAPAPPLNRLGILVSLLLIALSIADLWAIVFLKIPVRVTLKDGQIQAQPAITKGWSGLKFDVENQGTERHQFILIVTGRPAGKLPVKDGVAQFFSDPGEQTSIIYDGFQNGGTTMWGPQENPPLGPPMQPGEKRAINYGYSGLGMAIGEQTITILCNLPGHYEQGEYATVTLTQ